MAEQDVIQFYGAGDEYGCFSNFALYPVKLKGKVWPTVEHYFQAQKFAETEYEEKIRQAKGPAMAKKLGNSRKYRLREDWETVKDSVMFDAVLAKFEQNEELRKILLDTGDAKLVEHTGRDSYWGDGADGTGKNKLGKTLMKVREHLRSQKT